MTIAEGIRRIDENDILIASELPVLKAIIQKQDAHSHFLGSLDRGNAVFPDENGDGREFSRHHVGLVPCHLLGYEDGSPIRYTAAFFFKAAFIASADDGRLLSANYSNLRCLEATPGNEGGKAVLGLECGFNPKANDINLEDAYLTRKSQLRKTEAEKARQARSGWNGLKSIWGGR